MASNASFASLKVKELKRECAKRSIPTTKLRKKADLMAALLAHVLQAEKEAKSSEKKAENSRAAADAPAAAPTCTPAQIEAKRQVALAKLAARKAAAAVNAAEAPLGTNERKRGAPAGAADAARPPPQKRPAAPTAGAPPICRRCGGRADGGLCITWCHTGDVQRERDFRGWDRFRMSCCGRLMEQPCFVGAHATGPGAAAAAGGGGGYATSRPPHGSLVLRCCGMQPALLTCTKKAGPNQGRYFWRCPDGRAGCGFFKWADVAAGVQRRPVPRTVDGVNGVNLATVPWADPLGDQCGGGGERRRLLAAVLTREAALFVCGGAFSQSAVRSEELVANALAKLAKVVGGELDSSKLLYPLTAAQVAFRFGDPRSVLRAPPPAEEEVKAVLGSLLAPGSAAWLVSVVKQDRIRLKVPPFDHVLLLNLQGIESYFAMHG